MVKRVYMGAVCGEPGNYGMVFPDFPGCTSAADTLEDLALSAHEAISGHVEVMQQFGDTIPEPTAWTLDEISARIDPEGEETWLNLAEVEVDIPIAPATVAVLVPSGLAAEIDAVSVSRSDFVKRAVTHELARVRKSA